MGLKLQTVPTAQGLLWVRLGFTQFLRHPMAYASVLVLFMVAVMVVSMLPVLGSVLVMMAIPVLSLAFMHATHEGVNGRTPRPGVLVAMWRETVPKERRRALLTLCLTYALLTLLGLSLCELIDDGNLERFMDGVAGNRSPEEIEALASAPGVFEGALGRLLVTAALGVPFWHAPALVLWGGQGVAQALFSSALAVWRAKGAFLLYGLGWMGAISAAATLMALVLGLLGQGQLSGLFVMPLALLVSTAYYVSLYFTFVDSFGQPGD